VPRGRSRRRLRRPPGQPLDEDEDDEEEDEEDEEDEEEDDDAGIVHGGAVAALLSDGSTWPCVGGCDDEDDDELLELLELLELELLELALVSTVHGGTTSRSRLLFSAITSWFCTVPPLDCGVLPPGDMRIVLTACWGAWLELELLLELLELLLEELDAGCGGGHGGTATVWASVPRGTMIVVDPAGGLADLETVPTPPDA
jgi:hypothetical protein